MALAGMPQPISLYFDFHSDGQRIYVIQIFVAVDILTMTTFHMKVVRSQMDGTIRRIFVEKRYSMSLKL